MDHPKTKTVFALLCVMTLLAFPGAVFGMKLAASPMTITPPASPVPEGNDFATLVLRDPWDMSQYTDISQYLNNSGQSDLVRNVTVSNGLFSAVSSPRADASFWPLFAGYGRISTGKVGHIYPVDKSIYKCMYIAMQVNSRANDSFQVFWFASQATANGQFGSTKGIPTYPEAGYGKSPKSHFMRIYQVNLPSSTFYNTSWNNMTTVQGLRIDPTAQANIAFSVDWVRLTDCNPVNASLTWTGGTAADTAIWLQPFGTTRKIRAATGVDGSSGAFDLDTEGIAPGSYYVGLGTDTTCLQFNTSSPLVINQKPIVTFSRPSFLSGPGKSWDFNSNADVTKLQQFKSTSIAGGFLNMVTAWSNRPDPRILLTTPILNTNAYRYLSFRMSTKNGTAPWQNIAQGMIARWVWTVERVGHDPCNFVSTDISYDVGFQTYSIDLYNPKYGKALGSGGDCAGLPKTWQDAGSIAHLRFDPNENVSCRLGNSNYVLKTCGDFVQKLDWIRLTAIDQVMNGSVYPIQVTLNRLPGTLLSIAFYYTTDRSKPMQNPAVGTLQTKPSSKDVIFQWDTTGVPPATYYICTHIEDGFNPVTYCSEAAVIVTPVITTTSFQSTGSQDGWILEQSETANVGGTKDNTSAVVRLGDDATRKQYRSILSFNTATLPDNAIVSSVQLKLKFASSTCRNCDPISLLRGIMVDFKNGVFGSTSALELGDFQVPGSVTAGPFSPRLSGGYLTIDLGTATFASINNGGLTQIRLRFNLDDNNDYVADTLDMVSGDSPTVSDQPTLIVGYYLP